MLVQAGCSSQNAAQHNCLHKLLVAFFIHALGVSSKCPTQVSGEPSSTRENCPQVKFPVKLRSREGTPETHGVLRGAAVWMLGSMLFSTKHVKGRSEFEPTSLLHVEEVFAGVLHRQTDWQEPRLLSAQAESAPPRPAPPSVNPHHSELCSSSLPFPSAILQFLLHCASNSVAHRN